MMCRYYTKQVMNPELVYVVHGGGHALPSECSTAAHDVAFLY